MDADNARFPSNMADDNTLFPSNLTADHVLLPEHPMLARKLTYRGKTYPLHIAVLHADGTVTIAPFQSEIPSTLYFSDPIEITVITTSSGPRLKITAAHGE